LLWIDSSTEIFGDKGKQCSVPFDRDTHYWNWSISHSQLRRAVARLARLKASTPQGLAMKATVLALAQNAWDDPEMWSEQLQKSIFP
jgi:hypothetical protein